MFLITKRKSLTIKQSPITTYGKVIMKKIRSMQPLKTQHKSSKSRVRMSLTNKMVMVGDFGPK